MGAEDHKRQAAGVEPVPSAVITVSDTRTIETDQSGRLIQRLLGEAGHPTVHYALIPNDEPRIRAELEAQLRADSRLIVFTGGTGLSKRDRTVDVVSGYFEKRIDGFGELFRWLSYDEIGAAAMLSRAEAGAVSGRLVVCLPGSSAAVELALRRLLLPELRHLIWELGR